MPKKHCNGCNQDRDIEDFNLKDKAKGTRHAICCFCMAEYSRKHYKNNKQAYIDKTKKRNQRISEDNRTKLFAYLSQHPCVDCDETDAHVLEFDHVKGKKSNNISKMVMDGYSWSTIEIGKSTRLNSSHQIISYAVFCLKKKTLFSTSR